MLPGLFLPPMHGAGASLVVPDSVNWPNISSVGWGQSVGNKQITGIGQTIALRAEISSVSASNAGGEIRALVNSAEITGTTLADSAMIDFDVDPLQFVDFFFPGGGSPFGWTFSCSVAVKYKSAGSSTFDQTLDTFSLSLSG